MSIDKKKPDTRPAAGAETSAEEAADLDAVMRKYDRESATRMWEGTPQLLIRILMAVFGVFCIGMTLFSKDMPEIRLTLFVGCIVIIGFLTYPASKHHVRVNYLPWYDIVLMVVGAFCFFYFALNAMTLVRLSTRIETVHVIIGVVGILILMELCRRCVGLPILVVAGLLVVYAFYNQLSYGASFYKALQNIIYKLFYTTSGVIGTPVSVCYTYIVLFIIFGAFLERTGIAKFFIDLANKAAGASSGGPAKVAVISSALCGMVSGSSVGNTVTTGSVTIPMMKKTGYPPEFAGAVEAASSTGGQIMPPIMGAAAFLMAEYVNLPYGEIALKAILPAFLYFAGIFVAVHLEAKKLGLKGLSRSEMVPGRELAVKSYLLIPIVLLIVLVSLNVYTMQKAAALSIIAAIIVGVINKDSRLTPAKFLEALEAGGKGTITVAASPTPHAEILAEAAKLLAKEGWTLEVTEFEDYVQPNLVVDSGEIDANYFQHTPHLDDFNEKKGTDLVAVAAIHYEPFGIYPGTKTALSDLADGDVIAVPNDTTNEARALLLLQDNGVIKLADGAGLATTVKDIVENPHNVKIQELEAAQVSRVKDEVAFVVLNGNYALQAGFSVAHDAVAYEASASAAAKTYANVLVVKAGNENNEGVQALVKVLKSDEIKQFINDTYDGAVIPFED